MPYSLICAISADWLALSLILAGFPYGATEVWMLATIINTICDDQMGDS